MAEFQEVARHWKRMCKKYWTATSCHGCPIAEYERGYEACSAYEADVAKMEELVMSWAAEHPEPVYPTWIEWLKSMGVVPYMTGLVVTRGADDDHFHDGHVNITAKALEAIPADIAEKLGSQPRRG